MIEFIMYFLTSIGVLSIGAVLVAMFIGIEIGNGDKDGDE
jgi:hypothetical protein